MDLRAEITRVSRKGSELFRRHVAPRPMLAGGVAAAVVGLAMGLYFAPGRVWEPTEQKVAVIKPEAAPRPVTLMVDANGRTPDYVIGTDHVRGAPDPDSVVKVTGPPTPRPEETEALAEAGDRHWWAPWSWSRPDVEDIRDREAERLADARAAAEEARWAARERLEQRRYQARMEEEERRYAYEAERYGRRTYEPEEEDYYEAPPEPRRRPRYTY